MKKKWMNWMNSVLASMIVGLGFCGCHTTKSLAIDPTVSSTDNAQPPEQQAQPGQQVPQQMPPAEVRPKIEPPVCVYGPPSYFEKRAVK